MSSEFKPVPVIIADPFPFGKTGIYELIRKKDEIAGIQFASSLEAVFDLIKPKKYEWVIITDTLIAQRKEECIPAIINKCNVAKILVLTSEQNIFRLHQLKEQGAKALIHKINTGDEIKKAMLHFKEKNEIHFCPVIANILKTERAMLSGNKKVILSEQQKEYFLRMLQDKPNKIIAHELNITLQTASTYRREVKKKIRKWGKEACFNMRLLLELLLMMS